MKNRIISILILVILCSRIIAQPPETIYQGTVIKSGSVDDVSYGPFNIGFNFTFFGISYSQFYASSNGLVLFTHDTTNISGAEVAIPDPAGPNNFIAAFWDDLVVDGTGKILYTTIGAAPNRKLIIQFGNMGFYGFPALMGTFAVILNETSNIIQVQYRLIVDNTSTRAHGGSASIGIENSDGTAGVQYAYHNPAAVITGKALSYTPSGSTYTLNADAIYEGIYLTTNITLPDPGIPALLSPPQNAVIGSGYNFSWSGGGNSASYSLLISGSSDLGGATYYSAGSNTSYNVTGLTLDSTYYWGVFATNATGTTWCEIKKFTTSANPPLAAVPQTIWMEQNSEKIIKFQYTGGDASAKTAIITSLPAQGKLYQYNAGVKGSLITAVPATVTDPGMNVIYDATGNDGNGAGNFNFKIHDAGGDSPEVTITINVSPPRIPNVLYIAKSTSVEIQFDVPMADPTGKQNQFTATVNAIPATINSASLKTGDPSSIILVLATPLAGSETVLVSYTQGDVSGSTGGLFLSFTNQTVTLTAQTINFPVIPEKQIGDLPFNPGATASSGLGITYSSSNLSVATSAGSNVTILSVGTSDITARQAGNGIYAPARYTRTLTVNPLSKTDQTITFGVLPDKTYGDADFAITASASSGLSVSFSSDNPAVATVSAGLVHITGAGTAVITASQNGDGNYNAASPIPQTLTVSKATLTFTADNKTRVYLDQNPDLTFLISGFVNGETQNVLDVLPLIQTTAVQNSPVGSYPITLSGGSDNNYSFVFTSGTLTITKSPQTITFTDVPEKLLVKDTYTLAATSTSGLPVLFESSDVTIATVNGNLLTGVSKGDVQIRAYNSGNQNYDAADTTATVEIYSTYKNIMYLFTPNNDGFNDYWELPDLAAWGKCDVKVYNRWGKMVFSDPDYNNLWDGTSDGNPLPEGAYYFIIKTENAGMKKGTVNIVR